MNSAYEIDCYIDSFINLKCIGFKNFYEGRLTKNRRCLTNYQSLLRCFRDRLVNGHCKGN
jgi:hypothetical protein